MEPITEEMGIHKEWMIEAREQTLETLPDFITKLTTQYDHDYGTICHAIAAAAVGAAWAVEKSPQGGITGFQAGAITWEIIRGWNGSMLGDCGAKIVKYENMLYPQYEQDFDKKISSGVWKNIKKQASENLALKGGNENVLAHWKSIADGVVPFGYEVEAE